MNSGEENRRTRDKHDNKQRKNVQGTLLSEEFERTVPLDDYVFYFVARTFNTVLEGFAKSPIR